MLLCLTSVLTSLRTVLRSNASHLIPLNYLNTIGCSYKAYRQTLSSIPFPKFQTLGTFALNLK
jgi:hypothetical protein